MRTFSVLFLVLISLTLAGAQSKDQPGDKFRQLSEDLLPTPTAYRTASGAPGNRYWQNRADYVIDVSLDEKTNRISGKETITYHNNSPDALAYLWLQIDANIFSKTSQSVITRTAPTIDRQGLPIGTFEQLVDRRFEGSANLSNIRDARGNPLRSFLNGTMLRIDLPAALAPGADFSFSLDWNYEINNARVYGGRTGYEVFPNGTYIYELAQWFPRMAAYYDVYGWQTNQFLGSGEFTLDFGNYLVRITTPNDHVVAATGVLQNAQQVLKPEWISRLKQAETAREPFKIITNDEARANESSTPTGTKTWVFKAENVRDFAWASSRKYIWDAMGHTVEGNKVMAQSFYPNEGNPLWEKYSTHAVIHCMNVYSKYTFPYPYPVAQSVNGPIGGMEYPMISFNGQRPNADGTYTANQKYGLISVIIHEVGHNYFPMIINSDERQWTWMDEGLNTFLQYLAEQEWEKDFPSGRGEPQRIAAYMASENQVPIMTHSDEVLQFGNNAYGKPATALNVLRESVLGRDLFDFAFKTYARRWMFKRPTPADLFRTIEDASGQDLDWFWRGWFYTTDHVDLSIENVRIFEPARDPASESKLRQQQESERPPTLSQQRNETLPKRVDQFPSLRDKYNEPVSHQPTPQELSQYEAFLSSLSDREKQLLAANYFLYVVDVKNIGGLVMPLTFKLDYNDGTSEIIRVPAEIWRYNNFNISKLIVTRKEVKSIVLDPFLESGDTDLSNNAFPRRPVTTRFPVIRPQPR